MVEQWIENSCVAGSSPACATNTPIDKLVKSLSSKGSILKDIRVRISVGVPMLTVIHFYDILRVINSVEEFWSSKPAVRGSNPL